MLASLPVKRSPMSFSSFGTFRSNISRDEAERVNVFALVLGRAADGFDGRAGNRNADVVIILFPFRLRLDVVGIVKHDAAFFERADVVFVGMLVKRQQHVRLVAGAQHFARTDAHLENGRAAGNRGREWS